MSMIIVRYINGQTRIVQAQSWRQLDSESAPLGAILLSKGDGGGKLYAVKSSIYEVEEIPDDAFKAMTEKHDKDERDRKVAVNAAWRKKPLKRLFSKKPFPEVM